jgi:bifunctional DNA-binding transcriptional regulator/antitoxin component of YhaV-PrlF toxin-antitoxin module
MLNGQVLIPDQDQKGPRAMRSVTVKVSETGWLHLPAKIRRTLGLEGAAHVVLTIQDGEVRMRTIAQTLQRIRDLARPFAPKRGLASGQLIAARREEARREDG